jgi:hypothetical protein
MPRYPGHFLLLSIFVAPTPFTMNLSSAQKAILGILTFLPFFITPYVVYQIFQFVIHTVQESQYGDPDPAMILTGILSFIIPVILLSLLSLTLMIFYIIHAVRNKALDTAERIIWIVLFLFIGLVSLPIYFFMRIWNAPQQ